MEGGGGLDNASLKRIYDAKLAAADASSEENEALGLYELVVEKPPASLARSAHLVRGDHHHLVKEGQKDRKFMSSTWTGRPSSPGDDPTQQELALHASTSTASLGMDRMTRYGVLDSRMGIGSRGSHIISTPKDPRNLSLAPIDSWLMDMNTPQRISSGDPGFAQHLQLHHLGRPSLTMQLDSLQPSMDSYSHQMQHQFREEPRSNIVHLDMSMNAKAPTLRERNNSISMESELSSMSPSRRASLESMQSMNAPGTPRVAQWEMRLKTADSLDDDIQSQVSAPVPSTPEPKSVTMLVKDMNERSVTESLGGSASSPIE